MSRPPFGLKVTGTVRALPVFELPDLGFLGLFAGAHRRHFPFGVDRARIPSKSGYAAGYFFVPSIATARGSIG